MVLLFLIIFIQGRMFGCLRKCSYDSNQWRLLRGPDPRGHCHNFARVARDWIFTKRTTQWPRQLGATCPTKLTYRNTNWTRFWRQRRSLKLYIIICADIWPVWSHFKLFRINIFELNKTRLDWQILVHESSHKVSRIIFKSLNCFLWHSCPELRVTSSSNTH